MRNMVSFFSLVLTLNFDLICCLQVLAYVGPCRMKSTGVSTAMTRRCFVHFEFVFLPPPPPPPYILITDIILHFHQLYSVCVSISVVHLKLQFILTNFSGFLFCLQQIIRTFYCSWSLSFSIAPSPGTLDLPLLFPPPPQGMSQHASCPHPSAPNSWLHDRTQKNCPHDRLRLGKSALLLRMESFLQSTFKIPKMQCKFRKL